jgi:gluconolactonase
VLIFNMSSPTVVFHDKSAEALLAADPTITVVGFETFGFTEGPVWCPNISSWIFSDIPKATQYKYEVGTSSLSVYRQPSNNSNGNILDAAGNLISCEHRGRCVSMTDLLTGEYTVLATEFGGKRLTSPNDVIVSQKDGSIWFTDPAYGTMAMLGHGEPSEQPVNCVYRLDTSTGALTAVATRAANSRGTGGPTGPLGTPSRTPATLS